MAFRKHQSKFKHVQPKSLSSDFDISNLQTSTAPHKTGNLISCSHHQIVFASSNNDNSSIGLLLFDQIKQVRTHSVNRLSSLYGIRTSPTCFVFGTPLVDACFCCVHFWVVKLCGSGGVFEPVQRSSQRCGLLPTRWRRPRGCSWHTRR